MPQVPWSSTDLSPYPSFVKFLEENKDKLPPAQPVIGIDTAVPGSERSVLMMRRRLSPVELAEWDFRDFVDYCRVVLGEVDLTEMQKQIAKLMAVKISYSDELQKLLRPIPRFYKKRHARSMRGK